MIVTSLQNQRVKNAIKLRGHRERKKQKQFVIDGIRELNHAVAGGVEFETLFVCRSLASPEALKVLNVSGNHTVLETNEAVWEKLTFGNRNDGVLAVAKVESRPIDSLKVSGSSPPLVVILDQVEKPGNVGAVIRTADGAGASAVIVTDATGDLFNPNLIRASLGTVFRMPVVSCSATEAIEWLDREGMAAVVARVGAESHYADVDLTQPVAIVVGSEAEGVGPAWHDEKFTAIGLPMNGFADSLNVSTSAAVVMYEAVRQRRSGSSQ